MGMMHCEATGLVYTNPQPHLRAVHAWHPSIVPLENGELLCSFDLGQAAESLDYRTYFCRSTDGGVSWDLPRPLIEETVTRPTTHTVRVSRLDDGTLIGAGARFYRDRPDQGLTNRDTLGFVPMDLVTVRSRDGGATWSRPVTIKPPLEGPAFEVCHAVRQLTDGRCLLPTQTWPDWEGRAPNGMQAVAFVSHDGGTSWPEYLTVFDGRQAGVIHFEQSVVQLRDGRLLATAWAYDSRSRGNRRTPYALSADDGRFSIPAPTGLCGETAKLLALSDGRALCVYRRSDKPGLWAQLVRIEGNQWRNLDELLLWQGAAGPRPYRANMSDQLSSLKFGYPNLVQLPDGTVRIVFWCDEDGLHVIRWFRLSLRPESPSPLLTAGKQQNTADQSAT